MRSFTSPLTLAEIGAETASLLARIFKLHYEAQEPGLTEARRRAKERQLIDLRAQLLKLRDMAEAAKRRE